MDSVTVGFYVIAFVRIDRRLYDIVKAMKEMGERPAHGWRKRPRLAEACCPHAEATGCIIGRHSPK